MRPSRNSDSIPMATACSWNEPVFRVPSRPLWLMKFKCWNHEGHEGTQTYSKSEAA